MNWSGGLQYEFANNLLMEAMYQGSAGVGLLNNWDINAVPPGHMRPTTPHSANIRRNIQNFKPYPQFGQVQLYSNFGHNTYHSATIRVERRYRRGFFANGFYTWSKNLTDADADGRQEGVTYYNLRIAKRPFELRYLPSLRRHLHMGASLRQGSPFPAAGGGKTDLILGGWDLTFSQNPAKRSPHHGGTLPVRLPHLTRPDNPMSGCLDSCGRTRSCPTTRRRRKIGQLGLIVLPTSLQTPIPTPLPSLLSCAVYARHARPQHANVTRNHLGANIAFEDVEASGSVCGSRSAGMVNNLDSKHINFSDPNLHLQRRNTDASSGRLHRHRGSLSDVGSRLHHIRWDELNGSSITLRLWGRLIVAAAGLRAALCSASESTRGSRPTSSNFFLIATSLQLSTFDCKTNRTAPRCCPLWMHLYLRRNLLVRVMRALSKTT